MINRQDQFHQYYYISELIIYFVMGKSLDGFRPIMAIAIGMNVPFEYRLQLHLAIDNYNRMVYKKYNIDYEPVLLESKLISLPYGYLDRSNSDIDSDMDSNTNQDIRSALFEENRAVELPMPYFDRHEVYDAINKYSIDDSATFIISSLDSKFPQNIWKDEFPDPHVLIYLSKEFNDWFSFE